MWTRPGKPPASMWLARVTLLLQMSNWEEREREERGWRRRSESSQCQHKSCGDCWSSGDKGGARFTCHFRTKGVDVDDDGSDRSNDSRGDADEQSICLISNLKRVKRTRESVDRRERSSINIISEVHVTASVQDAVVNQDKTGESACEARLKGRRLLV